MKPTFAALPPLPAPKTRRETILVVGDASRARKRLHATLREAGYEAEVANGSEAVSLLETSTFSAVVMEISTHVLDDVRLIDYLVAVHAPVLSSIVLLGSSPGDLAPYARAGLSGTVASHPRASDLLDAIEGCRNAARLGK